MNDLGYLLAIDPGICSSGLAVFKDGELALSARVIGSDDTSLSDSVRCLDVVRKILEAVRVPLGWVATVAIERPVIYPGPRGKGDPNNLLLMWGIDCALLAVLRCARVDLRIAEFKPAEWCGQVPKATKGSAWSSPRGARVRSRLSPNELTNAIDQHDAVDAVGIGLYALGRLEVRRALASQ